MQYHDRVHCYLWQYRLWRFKFEYTFCKSVLKDFLFLNEMMARSQNLGTILLNKLLKSKENLHTSFFLRKQQITNCINSVLLTIKTVLLI